MERSWYSTISAFCMAAPPSRPRGTRAICAGAISLATVCTARRRYFDGRSMGGIAMAVIDEIFALYRQHGSEAYFGERVSMTEHGLQAAHFAREAGAPPALIVAA